MTIIAITAVTSTLQVGGGVTVTLPNLLELPLDFKATIRITGTGTIVLRPETNQMVESALGDTEFTGTNRSIQLFHNGYDRWLILSDTDNGGGGELPLYQNLQVIFDGGGAPLQEGDYADILVPFDSTLDSIFLIADQSGSVDIDIQRSTYSSFPAVSSIVGAGTAPTLSSAQKYNNTDFSDWTSDSLAQGDILRFYVGSNANAITRLTVSLRVLRI